jgi:hypothetical protein
MRRSIHRTVLVTTFVVGLLAPVSGAGAAPAPDGLSVKTASPSCWAIKQAHPSSPSGVYWLQTPTLVTAQQFYCDMTTDGGGWVLVGRGRDKWLFDHNGQGSPSAVRQTPTGTGAFAPAALSSATIDGLLDGSRPDSLPDGIRIRRARNKDGSQWQEVRWRLQSLNRWSWGFPGGYLLSQTVVDGTTYTGGNTKDSRSPMTGQVGNGVGSDDGFLRLYTTLDNAHNKRGGFSYGSSVGGENNSTSYLWEYGSENRAIAFTQVFIRPRITSVVWPEVPAEGLPAQPLPPLLRGTTSPNTPWGVTGVNRTSDNTAQSPVLSLAQVGGTVFVGGRFENVQYGASGTPQDQPYLAAFDVDTGEWRSGFRPELDGAVWDMVGTADGRLIVGGEFTSVNGAPNTHALAALDPATGEVVSTWTAEVELASLPSATSVRALDIQDGWVYVGGNFTRIRGGAPVGSWVLLNRLGRVRLDNGKPAGNWKPNLTTAPIDLDASSAGDRVYAVGNFTVRNTSAKNLAVLSTVDGQLMPGLEPWKPTSSRATYQQAILEVGDRVIQGGAEHNLHMYQRADYHFVRSHITKRGGDFQAIAVVDGVVYASCHCVNWNYQDTNDYSNPNGFSRADEITYIGAYDATTLEHIPEFQPALGTIDGWGAWDLMEDSNGCMWIGGDVRQGAWSAGTGNQWLGGFGKLCPRDTAPPSAPTGLTARRVGTAGTDVTLSWGASVDDGGSVRYEVLRDGRVIASPTGRTFKDVGVEGSPSYAVRAIDPTGNRSASTPPVLVP